MLLTLVRAEGQERSGLQIWVIGHLNLQAQAPTQLQSANFSRESLERDRPEPFRGRRLLLGKRNDPLLLR